MCDIGSYELEGPWISLTLITITGFVDGIAGSAYTFTATVEPISTTLPIEYVWQAIEQTAITHTDGLSDTIDYIWEMHGTKIITVTASNLAGSVLDTHLITITAMAPVMPESVTIIAPEEGLIGYPYDFIASVDPVSTSLPLNYTWQASGQAPVTHTGGLSDTLAYLWDSPGTKVITVTATNSGGVVSATHIIVISDEPISGLVASNDSGCR